MILAAAMLTGMTGERDNAIVRLRRGDLDALTDILPQYGHRLYRFLLRMVQEPATAEDLFQQTWVRVMEKISGFRADERFDSWLLSIARNLAIDHLRRKQEVSLDVPDDSGQSDAERQPASGPDPLEQVLEFERGSILAGALARLPAIHREVLTLRFEEGMKLEEIAEVAGIPLSTVKSRLHRGLEGLKKQVETQLSLKGNR